MSNYSTAPDAKWTRLEWTGQSSHSTAKIGILLHDFPEEGDRVYISAPKAWVVSQLESRWHVTNTEGWVIYEVRYGQILHRNLEDHTVVYAGPEPVIPIIPPSRESELSDLC